MIVWPAGLWFLPPPPQLSCRHPFSIPRLRLVIPCHAGINNQKTNSYDNNKHNNNTNQ